MNRASGAAFPTPSTHPGRRRSNGRADDHHPLRPGHAGRRWPRSWGGGSLPKDRLMLCIKLYEGKWYGGKWCDVHDELPRSINATIQSVARRFWRQCRVYAEDGTVWQPRPADAFRLSFVRRIVAEIGLDNPTCPIPMLYERVGQCSLADLKERLAAAVMAIASRHHQSARSVDGHEKWGHQHDRPP